MCLAKSTRQIVLFTPSAYWDAALALSTSQSINLKVIEYDAFIQY